MKWNKIEAKPEKNETDKQGNKQAKKITTWQINQDLFFFKSACKT